MIGSDAHADDTLYERVNRISHFVVNVSDADRSREFYEEVVGLRTVATLDAPAQPFPALDITQGRFRGYVLDDHTGGDPVGVHLVEWLEPRPIGTPYPVFFHNGLAKFAIANPNFEEKLDTLRRMGVTPTNPTIIRGYVTITDPDGVIISFPHQPALSQPQLFHVHPCIRDVEQSCAFYSGLLGLQYWEKNAPAAAMPASQGPGAEMSRWDSHLFRARGDHRFSIDCSKIHEPEMIGRPYAEANHLGISRIALEVDDLDAAHAALERGLHSWVGTEARVLGRQVVDYGSEIGPRPSLFFTDPEGIMLELIEQPRDAFVAGTTTAEGYQRGTSPTDAD